MTKAIITGGVGFIGFNLTKLLLTKGFEIKILDNFSDYYSKESMHLNAQELENNGARILAEKILFLLKNPEKAKEIGKNGLSVLQTNSPEVTSNRWIEIFKLLDIL